MNFEGVGVFYGQAIGQSKLQTESSYLRVVVSVWSFKIWQADIAAPEHAYALKIRL